MHPQQHRIAPCGCISTIDFVPGQKGLTYPSVSCQARRAAASVLPSGGGCSRSPQLETARDIAGPPRPDTVTTVESQPSGTTIVPGLPQQALLRISPGVVGRPTENGPAPFRIAGLRHPNDDGADARVPCPEAEGLGADSASRDNSWVLVNSVNSDSLGHDQDRRSPSPPYSSEDIDAMSCTDVLYGVGSSLGASDLSEQYPPEISLASDLEN